MHNFFKEFAYIRKKRNQTIVGAVNRRSFFVDWNNLASLKTSGNIPLRNELLKMNVVVYIKFLTPV